MTDEQMIAFAKGRTKVTVTANDYQYKGILIAAYRKESGVWRCTVEDDCGRLFIHNAAQLSAST